MLSVQFNAAVVVFTCAPISIGSDPIEDAPLCVHSDGAEDSLFTASSTTIRCSILTMPFWCTVQVYMLYIDYISSSFSTRRSSRAFSIKTIYIYIYEKRNSQIGAQLQESNLILSVCTYSVFCLYSHFRSKLETIAFSTTATILTKHI